MEPPPASWPQLSGCTGARDEVAHPGPRNLMQHLDVPGLHRSLTPRCPPGTLPAESALGGLLCPRRRSGV